MDVSIINAIVKCVHHAVVTFSLADSAMTKSVITPWTGGYSLIHKEANNFKANPKQYFEGTFPLISWDYSVTAQVTMKVITYSGL